MHMLGRHQLAFQGAVAACKDAGVGLSSQLADDARVLLGQRQRDVSGNCGDAQHGHILGARQGQQNRNGVVLSGVSVDDDLAGRMCHGRVLTCLSGHLARPFYACRSVRDTPVAIDQCNGAKRKTPPRLGRRLLPVVAALINRRS